ncbi:MAG: efflux RND transporter permease subunit [Bacteroidetes bacterium]|nr:efflux RND transporter permease subunit [Bacteroidota bacterium]
MRKVVEFFIRYVVPVNVIIVGIMVFGVMGAMNMKSSFFPLVPNNMISVRIGYPGASPAEIEEAIVQKMEENMKGIKGIDRITSRSYENAASITIELDKGVDAYTSLQEIKNAVDAVTGLPGDMENPIVAVVENAPSTMNFTVSGEGLDLRTLKLKARDIEAELLAMDGISKVFLSGFPEEEIEIAVDENSLRAYDLTFRDIATAVATTNIITTGGTIKTPSEDYTIRVRNRNFYADEIDHIVVKTTPSGNMILLKDVAEVTDRFNESPDRINVNGEVAVTVTVQNTNEEDLVSTSAKLNKYVTEFNDTHANLHLQILNDRAKILNQRTMLLIENGIFGIFLVLLLLSIFLDVRIAFWVSIGLVFSFVGFFLIAPMVGVTINVLSLFALIMVIGILVDDGIVISENIYHHFEKGKTRINAAIDGTMEVMPAILSSVLTTMVAFTTFYFVHGRLGNFFSEVATVVIITLGISLFEAFIILPSHMAHSNALKKDRKVFLVNRIGDRIMNFLRDRVYAPAITFILDNRSLGMALFVASFLLTIGALKGGVIQSSFFPRISSDRTDITLRMPQGTNENITDSIISYIEGVVWETTKEFDEKYALTEKSCVRFIEKQIGPGTSNAELSVYMLEGEERPFAAQEFSTAVRNKVGPVHSAETLLYDAGTSFGGKPVSVSLESTDGEELKAATEMLKELMKEDERMVDIVDDDPAGVKEIRVELKPNAYLLGFSLNNVMSQVRGGFFGQQAQRIQRGRDDIRVWVRYKKENRNSIKQLDDMWLRSPKGERVPFSEIATYSIERGEVSINHLDGQRVINVSADLSSPVYTAPEILADIKSDLIPVVQASYPSIGVSFEGQSRLANKTMSTMKPAAVRSLLIIMFIIAFTFRTYGKQFLFLPIIAFSLTGVGWGHNIQGIPINMLSYLGIIALIGILVNDGLVLMAKFNTNIKSGEPYKQALLHACISRFRPIFLTTITTVAGLTPLLFEKSRQAQFLIPMAVSVVFGIIFATVLTLFLLPTLMSFLNDVKRFGYWLVKGKWYPGEEVERAYIEKKFEEMDINEH